MTNDLSTYVYGGIGAWQGEVRTEGEPGRMIGLVWQSGYYLTRRGALRAVRLFLYTGNPHAELLRHRAGWWRLLRKLRFNDNSTI